MSNNNDNNSLSINDMVIKVVPWNPDNKNLKNITNKLLSESNVRKSIRSLADSDGKKIAKSIREPKLLSFRLVDDPKKINQPSPKVQQSYVATYYDYDNNRSFIMRGQLNEKVPKEILDSKHQPLPNSNEFNDAVKILVEKRAEVGKDIKMNKLRTYRPMPPLIMEENEVGEIERTLSVGLLSTENNKLKKNEIIGVNMVTQTIITFENDAPPTSRANESICGIPYTQQDTAMQGETGQAKVTVKKNGKLLWDFIVTRPAASSGINGSGIELQFVNFRGKRILRRAGVPILNVKYDNDACGPFRDWQWEEGMIEANGIDVAPGFRLCPTPAKTILDNKNDAGSFLGVAIYVHNEEVVLVSEMEAGWYRYVSEWRLHVNGTIRPRFGFDAVEDSCVCNTHHHHVYWRLNFDVDNSKKNIVREFNDPPLSSGSKWHTIKYEIKRKRDPSHQRKWLVKNPDTDKGYMISPGPNDGIADTFARGDLWFLRYRDSQLDDGIEATGPPFEALLDNFVNQERIKDKDLVVWYAAHFDHTVSDQDNDDDDDATGHIVGPDLVPYE
jgi:hypothetical protein